MSFRTSIGVTMFVFAMIMMGAMLSGRGTTPRDLDALDRLARRGAETSRLITLQGFSTEDPSPAQGLKPALSFDLKSRLEALRQARRFRRISPVAFVGSRAARRVDVDYGQFNYRRKPESYIEINPRWVEQNLVEVSIPHARGEMKVKVHRNAREKFEKAFELIRKKRLQHLVHVLANGNSTFQQRFMKSPKARRHPRQVLSLHCWGLAIDINDNMPRSRAMNRRLWKEAFRPAGFRWGNDFRDPMHFEVAGLKQSRRLPVDRFPPTLSPLAPRTMVAGLSRAEAIDDLRY